MSKLQEVFSRIQETKKEQKMIKSMVNDAFKNSKSYQDIEMEIGSLKFKKKKIEEAIKDEFSKDLEKLDILKSDIDNDTMLLSDLALNELVKGHIVEVIDENNGKRVPLFKVTFKKN